MCDADSPIAPDHRYPSYNPRRGKPSTVRGDFDRCERRGFDRGVYADDTRHARYQTDSQLPVHGAYRGATGANRGEHAPRRRNRPPDSAMPTTFRWPTDPSLTITAPIHASATASTIIPSPIQSWTKAPPGTGSTVNVYAITYYPPPTPYEQNPTWHEVNKQLNANVQMTIFAGADNRSNSRRSWPATICPTSCTSSGDYQRAARDHRVHTTSVCAVPVGPAELREHQFRRGAETGQCRGFWTPTLQYFSKTQYSAQGIQAQQTFSDAINEIILSHPQ